MYQSICQLKDIAINTGVVALVNDEQVAVFRVKTQDSDDKQEQVFALSNFDPFSEANVLSRGIVGSLQDELVVASPIYKQHFYLSNGVCAEDNSVKLKTWQVKLDKGEVFVSNSEELAA